MSLKARCAARAALYWRITAAAATQLCERRVYARLCAHRCSQSTYLILRSARKISTSLTGPGWDLSRDIPRSDSALSRKDVSLSFARSSNLLLRFAAPYRIYTLCPSFSQKSRQRENISFSRNYNYKNFSSRANSLSNDRFEGPKLELEVIG